MATSVVTYDAEVHATSFWGDGANLTNVPVVISSSANKAAYFNGSNTLTYETYLATSRGGTGATSAAWTGLAKVSAGTWSAAALTDGELPAQITSSKVYSGTAATQAAYFNASGQLLGSNYLSTALGGTGGNSSAWTGLAKVAAGSWSAAALTDGELPAQITSSKVYSGTAATQAAYFNASGQLLGSNYLSAALGGTGATSASSTGFAYVTSGSWTFESTLAVSVNAAEGIATKPSYLATADNTPTALDTYSVLLGALGHIVITYRVQVALISVTNFYQGLYLLEGKAYWNGATLTVDTPMKKDKRCDGGLVTTDVAMGASTSNLLINVTGLAAEGVRWSGFAQYNKVGMT